ncbi:hypothetical protein J437_LFUL014802 [Ladona fulva]|uniref:Uncharacterized protein n=1 Tax=Ladona fulva TaxID=123851 RepID=A0A8K0P881_LADFU|nr:hypothetical protein J437_LFUL014802 [Ladona fulva]
MSSECEAEKTSSLEKLMAWQVEDVEKHTIILFKNIFMGGINSLESKRSYFNAETHLFLIIRINGKEYPLSWLSFSRAARSSRASENSPSSIPSPTVDESSLGIHQVELVVQASPSLGDGSSIAQHAHGTLNLGQITTWNHGRWLVVDADLETGGTPVHELDGALGLDGSDGSIHVLGHHVASVQHATGHVLAVTRIAFHHLVGGLEACVGDLGYRQLLVISLLGGNHGGVGDQREVDAGVGNQVGLEFREIDVQGAVEPKGGGDG